MAVFFSVLALGPQMLNIDGDLPRHLLMGKYVMETGSIPTLEIFAYPYEGETYVSHEWLAGVLYFSFYILLGLNGVVLLAGVLIACAFAAIYSYATIITDTLHLPNVLLVLLGAAVTSIHWIVRPHLFSMLFLVVWLIWLDHLSRGERFGLWRFPALMFLWANIHAEFIAGFLALLAYIAGWSWQYVFNRAGVSRAAGRDLFIITTSSLPASLINPSGIRVWETLFGYVNNTYLMTRIAETRPPDFSQPADTPLLILLVLSALLFLPKRKNFTTAQTFLLAGFAGMTLVSARNAHLFGVVAPLILPVAFGGASIFQPLKFLEEAMKRIEHQARGNSHLIPIVVLAGALMLAGPLRNVNRFEPSVFPVQAVAWLKTNPQPGRMFNEFDWGGYILFHLWPREKVFIESQTDTRGDLTRQYEEVVTLGNGWRKILEQYEIGWVIIPVDSPLANALASDSEWAAAYQDQTAVILIRK